MNAVLSIWRNYAGLMVLLVQNVILSQTHGIKLGEGWYVRNVAIKRPSQEVRSSIKHEHPLQLGLKLLGI